MSLLESDSEAIKTSMNQKKKNRKPQGLEKRFNKFSSMFDRERAKQKSTAKTKVSESTPAKSSNNVELASIATSLNKNAENKTPSPKKTEDINRTDTQHTGQSESKEDLPNQHVLNDLNTDSEMHSNALNTDLEIHSETDSKVTQPEDIRVENKLNTDSEIHSETTSKIHSENRLSTTSLESPASGEEPNISNLVSGSRKIMEMFYYMAKKSGNREIGPFTKPELAERLQLNLHTVRTNLTRLRQRGFIQRSVFRRGIGGSQKIVIPEQVFKQFQLSENLEQEYANWSFGKPKMGSQIHSQMYSETGEIAPSSSSSLLKNKTTTTRQELSGEWLEVIIPKELRDKIQPGVIYQCRDRGLATAKVVQESLDAFAFDVSENNILKIKNVKSPQGWFMSIMIANRAYPRPFGYETDEEKAEKELLERLEKEAAEKQERRKRIFDLSFKAWLEDLSEEEKTRLTPQFGSELMLEGVLESHFRENVFKEKYK